MVSTKPEPAQQPSHSRKTIDRSSPTALTPSEDKPTGHGRGRSAESEAAVMTATADLLKEMPLRDLTIEEIAKRAGVGKATIYKWWPSKASVALDAYLKIMHHKVTVPDTGSFLEDVTLQLRSVMRFYASPDGDTFRQFLAEAQSDPEFKKMFLERFLVPRRDATRVMWERAVKRGEVDPGMDVEITMDLIYGPLIFRLLSGHAALNNAKAAAIVRAAFFGFAVKQ